MSDELRETMLRHVVPHVTNAATYVGGEWNSVRKDRRGVAVSVALAFPDTYAVGMSHLGLQILYGTINRRPDALAERVYAPWGDMEAALRARGLPLHTLESFTPVREFNVLGFSLQYEMSFTNVLAMLDLAGLPLRAADRGVDDTLVIAGGPCALAPEPMGDFIDLFVIGDGEEVIHQLLDALIAVRAERPATRRDLLLELARRCRHVYAPSLYEPVYGENGALRELRRAAPDLPERIEAATVEDLDAAYFPVAPIVPFAEIIHDRITLEIMRGCPHRCRYCSAGWTRSRVRARSVARLVELAEQSYANTGCSEISLTSLSSSDYPRLAELAAELNRRFAPRMVNVSLPSLRVNDELLKVPALTSVVRRAGLTLAPEAATERLRRVIGKRITDEALLNGVAEAFAAGWSHVKLYFMAGLPTETAEDLDAMERLIARTADLGKRAPRRRGHVNVSVAPFVPKPHTPFQWSPMASREYLDGARGRLLRGARRRDVTLRVHRVERSLLEGVFSRGDRRLGEVVRRAWQAGCRFDAWDETFDYEKWLAAFRDAGLDPAFYAHRERPDAERLPWDHIAPGPERDLLRRERDAALGG